MNNHSIVSTHAKRQITNLSVKHSYTLYPSLSPYSWMDGMTDRETNTLAAHGLEELFSSCAIVSVLVLAGNRFWFYIHMYLEYNTVVALCYFFGSGGN